MSVRNSTCWSVTPSGTLCTLVSAYGTRVYSAWVPSIRCPKIQPMPPVARQWLGIARLQFAHRPHEVIAGTITRSSTARVLTAEPTSTTVPTASWPSTLPSVTAGTSPLRMCRSVPQMVVVSIRTTMSVGSTGFGSSTLSQDF